jgi:hypothetical protein
MRLLALERVDQITTVVYRWLDEPLTAPRTLYKTSADLGAIRTKLEQQFFSGEFNSDEFQIVVNEHEPPNLEVVFAGFTIIRLPEVALLDLIYAAIPIDFSSVERLLLNDLAPHTADPEQARTEIAKIMHEPVILTGFSRVALETVRLLNDVPFELQTTSARNLDNSDLPLIVAIGSDPGLSLEELQILHSRTSPALVVVNTEGEPAPFKAFLNAVTKRAKLDGPPFQNLRLITFAYSTQLTQWYYMQSFERVEAWLRTNFSEAKSELVSNVVKILEFSPEPK